VKVFMTFPSWDLLLCSWAPLTNIGLPQCVFEVNFDLFCFFVVFFARYKDTLQNCEFI